MSENDENKDQVRIVLENEEGEIFAEVTLTQEEFAKVEALANIQEIEVEELILDIILNSSESDKI